MVVKLGFGNSVATGTACGSWSSCVEAELRWPAVDEAAYLACAERVEAEVLAEVPSGDGQRLAVVAVGPAVFAVAAAAAVGANWLVHCETSRASLAAGEETVESN